MSLVSLTLPSDGQTAHVSDVNVPFNQLANVINGNLDNTNISSLSGTKIQTGTIPGTAMDATSQSGWQSLSSTLTYGSNNGNKEFTVTAPADLTSTLSPGMRMKLTRSAPAPTQAMAFVSASSQYATKTTPAGLTFTSSFTYETWIYLNSYGPAGGTGVTQMAVARCDNTAANGSFLQISSTGQIYGAYASGGTVTAFQSIQSLPLKRWVHVAVSVSSVASKTGSVYINGQLVPSTSPTATATALTQAGNLTLGRFDAANQYLDGYLAETRIWSSAQSQAQIQANMGINLGVTAGLVFCAPGNGNFNDVSGNANNLTPVNGAIATQAANPFSSTEYALVTKVSYSNPTTTVTLFSGTDYVVPNMTLNNPQYSTAREPLGFPGSRNKWIVDTLILTTTNTAGTVAGTLYNPGNINLAVPTGDWLLTSDCSYSFANTTTTADNSTGLSSSPTLFTDPDLVDRFYSTGYSAAALRLFRVRFSKPVTSTSITPWYVIMYAGAGVSSMTLRGILSSPYEYSKLTAESAYV